MANGKTIVWDEVKASNPSSQPFQDDLFAEQTPSFAPGDLAIPEHLKPDSPVMGVEELRALESQGMGQFFLRENTFDGAEEGPKDVGCSKFEELIERLKGLEGKTEAEIEAALDDIRIFGDSSLLTLYVMTKGIMSGLTLWQVTGRDPGVVETAISVLRDRWYAALSLGSVRLTRKG